MSSLNFSTISFTGEIQSHHELRKLSTNESIKRSTGIHMPLVPPGTDDGAALIEFRRNVTCDLEQGGSEPEGTSTFETASQILPFGKSELLVDNLDGKNPRWWDFRERLRRVRLEGGDSPQRAVEALRAATASFVFFASLTFSDPNYLSAVWIGNIFMHVAIQKNVGTSLKAAWGLASSILLTTLGSWPIAYSMSLVQDNIQRLILPPLIFVLSVLIMICPWLASPNLMILVMYINVGAPVRFNTTGWEPLMNMASYWIGLSVAIAMNLLPPTCPNTATCQAHERIERLGQDLETLWFLKERYTFNTGRSSKNARAAGAEMQVMVQRVEQGVAALRGLVPAVKIELWWARKYERAQRLEDWVQVLEASMKDFKMLRSAINAGYLGETNDNSTISTKHVRRLIADELGVDYYCFVQELIDCTSRCNQRADPYGSPTSQEEHISSKKLVAGIEKARTAFGGAAARVLDEVQRANRLQSRGTSTPVFAHIARRSTALYAVLSIAETLGKHMDSIKGCNVDKTNQISGIRSRCRFFAQSIGITNWNTNWPWSSPVKKRLSLKTALGMLLASLWVSSHRLWGISKPFGFWPGLTVASVNLATRGSSFHKAIDRLVGTLFAAAYALLIVDFFPGNRDEVKVPAIAAFTAFVIYMKNDDHAYQYSYAATSIGSMLYGSVKVEYNVAGYIPQRIQLIFVGVATFALIELFLFPQSSRAAVEKSLVEFLYTLQSLLRKTREFAVQMQEVSVDKIEEGDGNDETDLKPVSLQDLSALGKKLTTINGTLKRELKSALLEPYFGFAHKLHSQSLNGIVGEIGHVEMKSLLLVNALNLVSRTLEESDVPSCSGWHSPYADFLYKTGNQMDDTCNDLKEAFPDGRFRPQHGNTIKAIEAAASFREFRDVRFTIVSSWSDIIQRTENIATSDPNDLIVAGITTSFILELCRHLQLVGKRMETGTCDFPAYY